jgi:hypothetical protein
MLPRAVVIGAGLDGMLAAHAIRESGLFSHLRILDSGAKDSLTTVPYLPSAIPGLSLEPAEVKQVLWGKPTEYGQKMLGPTYRPGQPVGDLLASTVQAWDVVSAYQQLWARYHEFIEPFRDPSRHGIHSELSELETREDCFVFNTHSRERLCFQSSHSFLRRESWVAAEDDTRRLDFAIANQTIIHNGEQSPSWYQLSRVFDRTIVEWGGGVQRPPITGIERVVRPMGCTCDCWKRFVHLGRYAEWDNQVPLDSAYFTASTVITYWYRQDMLGGI